MTSGTTTLASAVTVGTPVLEILSGATLNISNRTLTLTAGGIAAYELRDVRHNWQHGRLRRNERADRCDDQHQLPQPCDK